VTPRPRTPIDFAIGALAAGGIAAFALRVRALDRGGALAAIAVGTATYGALGLQGAGVLLTFFGSSIVLSRVGGVRKTILLVDVGKTGPRDAAQVLANGGVAAACALASLYDERFVPAFAGAFAAAAADTWGTEIGTLARGRPRSLLTLRPIATGLSGGVTAAGSIAEVAGALCVALASRGLAARAVGAVTAGGCAGALADSLLGASLQTLRRCPVCERSTEREPHTCGSETRIVRGLGWFGNDAVNAAATACGALVAGALALRR